MVLALELSLNHNVSKLEVTVQENRRQVTIVTDELLAQLDYKHPEYQRIMMQNRLCTGARPGIRMN